MRSIMPKYYIVAAKPGGKTALKNEFKTYRQALKDGKLRWVQAWRSTDNIADLIQKGNDVVTGKFIGDKMDEGDAVEVEIRIKHNGVKYKLSDMPDE
ncbi:hypothetical protein AD933_02835 [Acetobacter malorum]|uniref:Uncharacterized protein n=2 Tax=Acetobacter malorum TaxID=178901 RepID=A0A149RWE6_9PROT|nr:hypothetical protein AD933_02835 [Acetobacter malorum]